jgi:ribonuclease BN (tRNA processing enzyme)
MRATILGCGEAFDDELPTTAVLIEGRSVMLLDCGYSAPPQVWRTVPDTSAIDVIYLSHGHADHYFGMPALLGRFWEEGRTKPLTIVSQASVLEQLRQLLELGYKGLAARYKFPVEYREVKDGTALRVLDFNLTFAPTLHSVPNLGVRVESGDHCVCFSGDGMFTETSRELYNNADLLVHEAYSFEPSPIHADFPSLVAMSAEQGVRRLAMVHVARKVRREQQGRIEELIQTDPERLSLPEPGVTY